MVRSLLEAEEYHLADCRFRNLSPKTLRAYGGAWEELIRWCRLHGEPLTLGSLNAANVKACAEAVRARSRGKRQNQSAALAFVTAIKVASRFLVDEDVLEADYLVKVKRPKVQAGVRRAFAPHEIQAIRGALAENRTAPRDLAMLALSLDTGLRIGELCSLKLPDVDLRTLHARVIGKGNRERVVPFGTPNERGGGRTARVLRDYLSWRDPRANVKGWLWISYDGYQFTDKGWRATFQKAAREAGVRDAVPHMCRHTYATRYLVRHWQEPGAVEALRYNMGHLSEDEYRVYSAEAGRILSDAIGRDSVYEESTREPVPLRPVRHRAG